MKTHLDPDCWLLVADGAKAIVLRNDGDAEYPNLKTVKVYEEAHAPTHQIGSDKPPTVHNSVGSARSSIEQTDYHQQAEDRFLHMVADDLDKQCTAGAFKSMIIAAPPIALGALRKCMSAQLKRHVVADIDRDFTPMPVYEIEKAVSAALEKRG
ncbi:MAG: host attachment protein [Caulobacterales bacterium]